MRLGDGGAVDDDGSSGGDRCLRLGGHGGRVCDNRRPASVSDCR